MYYFILSIFKVEFYRFSFYLIIIKKSIEILNSTFHFLQPTTEFLTSPRTSLRDYIRKEFVEEGNISGVHMSVTSNG